MRVINVLDDGDDMVGPLRVLAAGPDPRAAARCRWLLGLVEHLQAGGAGPALCAMLIAGDRLLLYPDHPSPRCVWVEVELPEDDPAQRLPAARFYWRAEHRGRGTLDHGGADEPTAVERAIRRAFEYPH